MTAPGPAQAGRAAGLTGLLEACAPPSDAALAAAVSTQPGPALATEPAAAHEPGPSMPAEPPHQPPTKVHWRPGEARLQGFFGAATYDLKSDGGTRELQDTDATLPTIGGGAQWKLAGEQIDFGFEGLLSFGWKSNASAFVSSGGGALVAVDVDLLVFDLYGGPFVNLFLGDHMRLYAGAGPLMQWCRYEQGTGVTIDGDDGSGFGLGYYARAGVEFAVTPNTMVGFAVRWSDVEVDLNDNLGDLQTKGLQYLVTLTQGF